MLIVIVVIMTVKHNVIMVLLLLLLLLLLLVLLLLLIIIVIIMMLLLLLLMIIIMMIRWPSSRRPSHRSRSRRPTWTRSATSKLGAFLDPVADKLIVSSALVLLVSDFDVLNRVLSADVFAVSVCIIIGREVVISALREWMAELGNRGVVQVGALGKVKTVFQMVSIALLLYAKPLYGIPVFLIGEIAFYVAAFLTLWSMWAYLKAAMPFLLDKTNGSFEIQEESTEK